MYKGRGPPAMPTQDIGDQAKEVEDGDQDMIQILNDVEDILGAPVFITQWELDISQYNMPA